MFNKLILWIIVIAAGIGLLISANIFRDTGSEPVANNPEATSEPTNSPEPQATQSVAPEPKGAVSIPAACQLAGEIRFINQNLYETIGAKIVYQNVDDAIRQIFWRSNPADGLLSVGPNLFEGLDIPNGEREIGVVLKDGPAAEYILTAAITYGIKQPDGATEEKVADCAGAIKVTAP